MIYKSKLVYHCIPFEVLLTGWLNMLGLRNKVKEKTGVHIFLDMEASDGTPHILAQHAGIH